MNIWEQVLGRIRAQIPEEDYRRWFAISAYASDSGDSITVWVPTESVRRHIEAHYDNAIDRALSALGRADAHVRLVVSGVDEDEDEDEDEDKPE
jgi:chromosomal replication initiation ATPase DnaA